MNDDQHPINQANDHAVAATEHRVEATSVHPIELHSPPQRIADLPTWKAGDRHPSIALVQGYLRHFGYLSVDEDVEEGHLDRPTSKALFRFQRHRQISETGEFDEATRKEMSRPICGTPNRSSSLRFNLGRLSVWDKRDLTYAFSTGPSEKQKITAEQAQAAVRRAFNTWETAGVQLRFKEVGTDEDPDLLIEWVPAKHDEATKEELNGAWIISDDSDMTAVPQTGTDAIAHANFPPSEAEGWRRPRIIHFDDTDAYEWEKDDFMERVALHEIGHALGLDHTKVEDGTLDPGKRSIMEPQLTDFKDLQQDDLEGIELLYTKPGPERFNAIWNKGSNLRQAAWGLTRDQLHDEVDKQKAESYRLQTVSAYVLPAGERYNAVFQKIDKDVKYSTRRTREEFDTRHDELKDQGFQLTDVNTFILSEEERWNGVWVNDSGNTWEAVLAKTSEEISQAIDQYKEKNFHPFAVNAYVLPDGEIRWNAVFMPENQFGGDRSWRLRRNKTREEFDSLAAEFEAEGYQPIDINTFILPDGQGERWNGLWQKLDNDWSAVWGWAKIDAERRTHNLEQRNQYQPWLLNAYVLPPALTSTTQITSFEPPPQANLRPVILGIAVDQDRVYATRYFETIESPNQVASTSKLLVLDRVTLQTIGEVNLGQQPRQLAINPRTQKIYVINRLDGNISVIDSTSLTVIKTIDTKQGTTDIAVNSVLNRIYVSHWLKRQIEVIDGETDEQLEPIPIGPGPWGLTVDETTNRLYVALSNRSFEPHVTALGVVIDQGNQRQIERIVPLGAELNQPHDVVVDPDGDRIYVANLGAAGDGSNGVRPNVMVLQRRTLELIKTILVTGPARSIALNSDARQVFVGTDRGLHVISASTLAVERIILVGKAPWTIAVAGGTARQVFVGDARTGELSRLA